MIQPMELYERLRAGYGEPLWWSDDPMVILVESILVQQSKWTRVRQTVLDEPGLIQPEVLLAMEPEVLAELIRPTGFHQAKARTIRALMAWYEQYGFAAERVRMKDQVSIRQELLAIRGIGEETADVILVYAFHKPSFIIDAYTRRLLTRLGLDPKNDRAIRDYFESGLPRDHKIYGSLHWLILEHCIQRCRTRPDCSHCPIRSVCRFGRRQENNQSSNTSVPGEG